MWWCGSGSVFSLFWGRGRIVAFFFWLYERTKHPPLVHYIFRPKPRFWDPRVSIWTPFWHPWAPFWCLFGGLDPSWGPLWDVWGQMSCLAAPGSVFHGFLGLCGGSLWSSSFDFSDFLMSKWELRLWTSFLVHFRWKKDVKTAALCC